MARDRGPARPLRRPVATRKPRKTLVVFCEGEKTEPEYLSALKREPEIRDVAAVDIRVETGHGGAVPETLVSLAEDAIRRAKAEGSEVDEVWCVFDVEWPINHPRLRESVERASRRGIKLAVSNPCFEIWLALHFEACGAFLENDPARRLRAKHDGSTDKGLDGRLYMPRRADAADRARRLDIKHDQDGTPFPHNNPSSGMYKLLASIAPASQPDPDSDRSK